MIWALLCEDQAVTYQCRMEALFHLQSASLPSPVREMQAACHTIQTLFKFIQVIFITCNFISVNEY
jgi:hypothetical protein